MDGSSKKDKNFMKSIKGRFTQEGWKFYQVHKVNGSSKKDGNFTKVHKVDGSSKKDGNFIKSTKWMVHPKRTEISLSS